MPRKPKVIKPGKVRKIIKPRHDGEKEKVEIAVQGADELYKEIRIENTLHDENGHSVKLKEDADVDVVVEADPSATVPAKSATPSG